MLIPEKKKMKYLSEGKNEIFIFENDKLNCFCVIAKNKMVDSPGLGGTRFISYDNLEAAVNDAKALSTTMLLKNVITKLPFTGAKQIIFCKKENISDAERNDILSFSAECVNFLKGDFITGTDMGLTAKDVSFMAQASPYILHGESGNTSYYTAIGVMKGLLKMGEILFLSKIKSDLKVLVQGVGKVGSHIVNFLKQEGMQVYISDLDEKKGLEICHESKANFVPQINQFQGDIFMPCATGGSVNYGLIKNMGVSIVAGSANNQLLNTNDDTLLMDNKIFYAPDFIMNSGGTIFAAASYLNWDERKIFEKIHLIPQNLVEIFDYARKNKVGTYCAAKKFVLALLSHDKF